MTLTRSDILPKNDRPLISVDVPEWGGAVFVRSMSGHDRDSLESGMIELDGSRNMENFRGRLAVRVVCDESGERIFADEDADAVGKKSAAALDRIVSAAAPLNRLGSAQVAELGNVSGGTQSAASGSASPAI